MCGPSRRKARQDEKVGQGSGRCLATKFSALPSSGLVISFLCSWFGLISNSNGFGHTDRHQRDMDWLPLKGLGSSWVCTLKDGVVNQSGAVNTFRFVDETEICTEDLLEGPKAFGTGDGDVGFLGWVVSV